MTARAGAGFRPGAVINELGELLDETLGSLIPAGKSCALLDYPDHANVGDSAIWFGERMYLGRRGVPVRYTCSRYTYSEDRLRLRVGEGTILIHGGGNLGDLWPPHQELREAVIRAFPRNKIIQLPQTIWFKERRNLARARAVFDGHPDLTILVRDRRSLELARNEFRATSLLCPDMAFALGPLQRPLAPDQDLVCLLRQDIESVGHASAAMGLNAVSVDWIADPGSVRLRLDRWLADQSSRHPRVSDWCSPLLAPLRRRVWDELARERVHRGCAVLARGKVVVTDRLHGHILSLLLGIQHVILDNSYGKVSSFYETWTRTSNLVHCAKTPQDAAVLARNLVQNEMCSSTAV